MKKRIKSLIGVKYPRLAPFALAVLLSISGTATSFAQDKIGINFAGRQWSAGGNTSETLTPSSTAGVVPQLNWNNLDPAGHDSGTQAQIIGPNANVVSDNSGTATGVTLTYTAQGMWSVSQTTSTGRPRKFFSVNSLSILN